MKVLILGDSPFKTTGFGRVNRMAMEAFLLKGWEVATVTGLQHSPIESPLPVKQFVPEASDPLGVRLIPKAIEEFNPDRIYATSEPGGLCALAMVIPSKIPFVAYAPIEGEPIALPEWRSLLKTINFFTCTEYGASIAKEATGKEVDWVYHGVDHDVFKVDDERRAEVRKMLGWDGKFVVMTVAANVRRKQHPRLIEAIAHIKYHYKQRDVVLYDHTVPFQRFWLEGWDLNSVAANFGVRDEVLFNPRLSEFGASVKEQDGGDEPTLPDLYRAADLFVLPSQVEGFGLPIAEAMACGVPVAVTKYAAGWELAREAQGVAIPVHDWEIHKSGVKYANVDPKALAKVIVDLKRDPKRLKRMRDAGLIRAKDFVWEPFQEKVVDAVEVAQPYAAA